MTRSQEEGGPWQMVPDPRDPYAVRVQSEEAGLAKRLAELQARRAQRMREDEMRAQIAALEGELREEPPSEPASEIVSTRHSSKK
jgi:cytochrome c-type biogenesis protein CcmH/NrfG